MKKLLVLAFLSPLFLSALELGNWSNLQTTYTPDGKSLFLKDGKNYIGGMSADKNCDIRKVTCTLDQKDGALVIDTRAYLNAYSNGRVVFHLANIPASEIRKGALAAGEVQLSAEPAGDGAAFSLTGERITPKGRVHFWQPPTPFLADDMLRVRKIERRLPDDLATLQFSFYFTKPGVYRIAHPVLSYPEEKPATRVVLPKDSSLVNGGAECGFYNVFPPSMKRMGNAADGKYYNLGTIIEKCGDVVLDSNNIHSGEYAFLLNGHTGNATDRFSFGQVPFYAGKPVSFSVWMKAEKEIRVQLWLHICNGTRYGKDFRVGTEWKKYTLTIPEFGRKAKDSFMIGNPVSDSGEWKTFSPMICVMGNGKVWADDARVEYALQTSDDGVVPEVRMTGAQEKSFVRAGEKISVDVKLESSGEVKSGPLSWKLTDVFGKIILESAPVETVLPFEKRFEIAPPANFRGPLNLSFTFGLSGGKVETYNFLTGVIGPEKPLHHAFGTNVDIAERSNSNFVSELLKAFRIGSVRIWRNGAMTMTELDCAKLYHDKGFYTLYCLSYCYGPSERFLIPADPTEYLKKVETLIRTRTKGSVDAYEIFNESNLWNGYFKGADLKIYKKPTLDAIVELTGKIADVIRKNDPGAKIAGPATCHTAVPWIQTYLEKGAKDMIDIISEHPYRYKPEMPDYADDLRSIREISRGLGKNYPIYSSESGGVIPMNPGGNLLHPRMGLRAGSDLRLALIGFAGGLDKYFHFSSGEAVPGSCFSNFMVSDVTTDFGGWAPSPYLYAFRAAADILEEAKFVKQVRIGMESRCYIFNRGDKRIAALWKWEGEPAEMVLPESVVHYDLFGTESYGNHFSLNPCPVYIVSDRSADELEKLIRDSKISVSGDVCRLSVSVTGEKECDVSVQNLTAEPLSGVVKITKPVVMEKSFRNLPGEDVFRFRLKLPEEVSLEKQIVSAEISVPGRKTINCEAGVHGIAVPHAEKSIIPDGDLSDWHGEKTVSLTFKNAECVGKTPWNDAEKKIRAELKFLWDRENLYIAVVVSGKNLQPKDNHGEDVTWQGDSLQIAFDTVRNATPDVRGYQDDDYEYTVSLYRGKPLVIRAYASSALYDSLMKNIGPMRNFPVGIRTTGTTTVYEIAFPKVSLSPFSLERGSSAGFSLLINVGDGKERRGWLELTPGIGQFPKRPGQFTNLILR